MRLKLSELQSIVNRTIDEERASSLLREEIANVFGPAVVTSGKLSDVVAAANDRIDVLVRTGRSNQARLRPTVTAPFIGSQIAEIRKLVARTAPLGVARRLMNDAAPEVRAALAERVELPDLVAMIRKFPHDDQLRSTLRVRRLHEAGIKQPKVAPMGHDPVEDAERLGDLTRTHPGPELSDAWYREHAQRFMHDYGKNIEYAWESTAVRRFCSSHRATTGLEIDEKKLLDAIKDLIKEKEDRAMERDALQETAARLLEQDRLAEQHGFQVDLSTDPVHDLVSSRLNHSNYVERARALFNVRDSILPMAIRKHRLGEGNAKQVLVPVVGTLPHTHGFRAIDERALDEFCAAWNARQALAGEPLVLEWTVHPTDANRVGFTCVLR